MPDLSILQINARRARTATKEIRQIIDEREIDIACVQEPYVRSRAAQGYPVSHTKITVGDYPGAAIIVTNRQITTTLINQLSNSKVLCLEVKTQNLSFILVNMYFQYCEPVEPFIVALENILNNYQNNNILIVADANSKSVLWNSKLTDARGEQLEELIFAHNLTILNQPGNPPTYRGPAGASSNIDVTLATTNLANRIKLWKVEDGQTSSDHNIITFKISLTDGLDIVEEEEEESLNYNVKKMNWEKFKSKLKLPDIRDDSNVESLAEDIQNAIYNATRKATNNKLKRTRKKGGLPYWNDNLERLKRLTRSKRRSYHAARDPTVRQIRLQNYRNAKNEYENELEKSRKMCWENYIQNNLNLDPWGSPYKLVNRKIRSPTTLSTVKKTDGTLTTNWQETVNAIMETLIPADNPREDMEEHKINRIKARPPVNYSNTETTDIIVKNEEIEKIIKELKNNKAPGPDKIKAEILKNTKDIWIPYLARLYTHCFKQKIFPKIWKSAKLIILLKNPDKEKTNIKSYRPICLLNLFGKILEKLIVNRINKYRPNIEDCKLQYGFRKKKSTEDAINRLLYIAEREEIHGKKYVLSMFIDITGAFDHLWWPALLNNIKNLKVPKYILDMVYSYVQDREVFYEAPGDRITRKPTRGCPQGSVCGPIFWDITIDPCIQELDKHKDSAGVVAYADDVAILISANSRLELESKTQNIINTLEKWCTSNKLKISTEKTKYLLIKGKLLRNPIIKLNNKNIERVNTIKYLGINIDEGLNYNDHIKLVCQSALKTTNKLITLALGHYKISIKTIKLYYKAIITPIIAYGASVWGHRVLQNQTLAAKINSVQRMILLRMTGAYKTTPGNALTMIVGVPPLHLEIVRKGIMYWIKKGKLSFIYNYTETPITNQSELDEWITTKWQQYWNNGITGRRLYQILPSVQERENMNHFHPTRGLIHYLTGHGPYKSKLHELHLTENDVCECGEAIDTPEHKLFHCTLIDDLTREDRNQLRGLNPEQILRNEAKFKILNILANKVSNHYITRYINRNQ